MDQKRRPEGDHNGSLQEEHRQKIQLEIINLFREHKYKNVLKLFGEFRGRFDFAPEIQKLAEKATELLTAQNFFDKLSDDFQAFLQDNDGAGAEKALAKMKSIDPSHPELYIFEKKLREFGVNDETKSQLEESDLESLLETALIFFYKNDFQQAALHLKKILEREPGHVKAKDLLGRCQASPGSEPTGPSSGDKSSLATQKLTADGINRAADARKDRDILGPIINSFSENTADGDISLRVDDATPVEENSSSALSFNFERAASSNSGKNPFSLGQVELGLKKPPRQEDPEMPVQVNILLCIAGIIILSIMLVAGYRYYARSMLTDSTIKAQVDYLIKQAQNAIDDRQFEQAREIYTNALKLNPRDKRIEVLLQELAVLIQKRKEEEIVLAKDYVREAKNNIGRQNFDEAKRYLDLAFKADPQNQDLPIVSKRYQQELEKYQAALAERQMKFREKVRNLQIEADYYIQEGDLDKAKAKVTQILMVEPDNVLAIELMKELNARISKREETNDSIQESEMILRKLNEPH